MSDLDVPQDNAYSAVNTSSADPDISLNISVEEPTSFRGHPTFNQEHSDQHEIESQPCLSPRLISPIQSTKITGNYSSIKPADQGDDEKSSFASIFRYFGIVDIRLLILRITVILSLMATVIVVGYFSFTLLRVNETKLKNQHYNSFVIQLQSVVTSTMDNQYQALALTAGAYRDRCPTVSIWPNCSLSFDFMTGMSDNLIKMTKNRAIGFSPIITDNQVAQLEAYAYDFYATQGMGALGQAQGFKGIYARKNGVPYHMTTAATTGQNKILVPIVQIAKISENYRAYMFNLYSEPTRIANIDYMINCTLSTGIDCLAITDVLHLVQDPVYRPAVLLHFPIRLNDTNRSIVGMTSGVINWDTVFSSSLSSHVSGIHIVLQAERDGVVKSFTFEIVKGNAVFLGDGDLHHAEYDNTKYSFVATAFGGSAFYTLHVYSSSTFENEYYTQGPLIACIISVIVVVVTSLIFFAYDLLMNRRAKEKELVIQTRQQFVRFISHEIRTPVNTISLGMKLFSKEIANLITSLCTSELSVQDFSIKLSNMSELVRDVEQSSEAAIVILNDLINYDKLKGGILHLEIEEIMILDLIRKTIRPFKVQAKQTNVQIDIDLLASSGQFKEAANMVTYGDKVKLGQVLRNIISNALKFTPPGGTVTITAMWDKSGLPNVSKKLTAENIAKNGNSSESIALQHETSNRVGSLLLHVKDSGVGLTLEQQQNLFREGVQFNANKLQGGGGSGLGLFIAKGIVELHGGTLRGSSEGINKGSTFTLEIPVYLLTGSSVTEEGDTFQGDIEVGLDRQPSFTFGSTSLENLHTHEDALPSTPFSISSGMMISPFKEEMIEKRKSRRVLVVDDSPTARKMVSKLLTNEGYEVDQCMDGQACIDTVLDKYHDSELLPYYCAILLDSDMPGVTGLEVAARLRQAGYPWPIIGVTGHVHQRDIESFVQHGATMVLSKPLDYSRLEKVLNGYI